jgi:phosphate acetyltransferase
MIRGLQSRLAQRFSGTSRPLRIALPEFEADGRMQEAATLLSEDNSKSGNLLEIITSISSLDEANRAVAAGDLDGVVAGAVNSSGDVVRSAYKNIGMAEGISSVSSFFIMEFPADEGPRSRTYIFSDCAVQIDPSAEQLAEIAMLSAQQCVTFLDQQPLVAMLSFSTKGSAKGERVAKVEQATEMAQELLLTARWQDAFPGEKPVIDGTLQLDAALIRSTLEKKTGGASPLLSASSSDGANVLVFPNLDAGNIGYKLGEQLGGARAIGPILQGLKRPSNDLSRGCSVQDIQDVVWITAAQAYDTC